MTCREADEFLMDYIDGTLPQETRRRFEAHLAICPDCVAYVHSYRRTVQLSHSLAAGPERPSPPESLVRAIMQSVRRR